MKHQTRLSKLERELTLRALSWKQPEEEPKHHPNRNTAAKLAADAFRKLAAYLDGTGRA